MFDEYEQQDVFSHGIKSSEDSISGQPSTVATTLAPEFLKKKEESKLKNTEEKNPAWGLGRLVPKFVETEERKKKNTPMHYVAAHEHYEQVLRLGDCHVPREKVIRVHEVHPDPSKSYSPSCTILHQCGDDTGCCRDLKQECKPKNTTKVELYFFTTTLGKPQTVEKLYFINHTECECQKRTDEIMPRDSEFRRSHHLKKFLTTNVLKNNNNNCTCPSKYSTRRLHNGTCVCDCFDKQDDCLILKKGKAHFSFTDKLCIDKGLCLAPSCEFGYYIRNFGRCPSKRESNYNRWTSTISYRQLLTLKLKFFVKNKNRRKKNSYDMDLM
ncbi:conserved hypothetical protein [Pediculus humanus corporis]|uniref:Platelet-derived growth factor (PDGF) family profile domain-containing protein n=1 Tax=Pediculus humanus subsp. corporis TaxID=121224 RepID=E0VP50_PEDHC|nr:uncharacterized protein Phum_PHUM351770 [Pediculus humanus corporis]EEB15156.1 conserved hypothetical protein [Pediculus humanus corporis]